MNTPKLNNAQDTIFPTLPEGRRKMAIATIISLSDPEELRYVLDILNDVVVDLIDTAAKVCGNPDKQGYIINQLCYITNIADILIYLAGNNPINQKDHE